MVEIALVLNLIVFYNATDVSYLLEIVYLKMIWLNYIVLPRENKIASHRRLILCCFDEY
jgi:hypothetical protein